MGPPTKASTYGTQAFNTSIDVACSQLEETKCELKQIKSENMQKDGEVKILREKLKRQEQEMQRIRNDKLELIKKLQQQRDDAQKHLQKQIEFKDLENQFKSQELVELNMKYKQLESKIKKNPTTAAAPSPQIQTSSAVKTEMPMSVFEEEINKQKRFVTPVTTPQAPASNPIGMKGVPLKRAAQQSSSSCLSLSDAENENPVHESKRPLLNQQAVQQNQIRTHLSSLNNQMMTPKEPVKEPAKEPVKPTVKTLSTPQITQAIPAATTAPIVYKRSAQLSLKSVHQIKTDSSTKSSREVNEKIYKLIDLFAESANNLNKFNSTTKRQQNVSTEESVLFMNANATNLNILDLTKQLASLLEYLSKSAVSPILSDMFSSFISVSLTESSMSAKSTNSLLIIDRVEFVSNRLNDELVQLAEYCLNAPMQGDLVCLNMGGHQQQQQQPSLLTFTTILPNESSIRTSHSTDNLKRLINEAAQSHVASLTPASANSLVDLLCFSFEVCASLFLFRSSLLLTIYTQNQINRKAYKLIKPKQTNIAQQRDIYSKLIRIKHEFFQLISLVLKSINFCSKSGSTGSSQEVPVTLSTSSSSYSALKMLNSVLDCLNRLAYLPVLGQHQEPDSTATWCYFSVFDNMHKRFRKHIALNRMRRVDAEEAAGLGSKKKGGEATCMEDSLIEMEQDVKIEPILDAMDEDEYMEAELADKSDDEDEQEPCLLQLFYAKLIKYFGDVVYSNDARIQNLIDENSSLAASVTANNTVWTFF